MKNELNEVITWWGDNNTNSTASSTGGDMTMHVGSHYVDYDYYHTYWYPYTHPQIFQDHYTIREDNTKQAFKIVKLLMKKKLVKVDKVKDFVELIDEILEIL
jgi:hypothetical protein